METSGSGLVAMTASAVPNEPGGWIWPAVPIWPAVATESEAPTGWVARTEPEAATGSGERIESVERTGWAEPIGHRNPSEPVVPTGPEVRTGWAEPTGLMALGRLGFEPDPPPWACGTESRE